MKNSDLLQGERPELPNSLWAATASPAPQTQALDQNISVDVAIVGGGYTGCCAAIALARYGMTSAILEAAEPGWGASGRNNVQVIPGLKHDPDVVEKALGIEAGSRLVDWAGKAPAAVFELIDEFQIPCHPVQKGWIQPAFSHKDATTIQNRQQMWARRGVDGKMLDGAELCKLTGTSMFESAWLDPRGGSIHPLSYARGLAQAALSLGTRYYSKTRVRKLERHGPTWKLATDSGVVEAKQVIVATAAYSDDIIKGIKRSIIPLRTAQVASKPLSGEMLATILPQGHVASDTRRLLTSFRISPDGRLVMGGASATAGLNESGLLRRLHQAAYETFGHLGPIEWDYGWSGYLALTHDHLPHIHEPAPGLFVGLGCNGRGIALSTSLGKILADRAAGRLAHDMPIPVSDIHRYKLYDFRHAGVAIATSIKRFQDKLDRQAH